MKFTLDTNVWQIIAAPEKYEGKCVEYNVALYRDLQKQIFLHPENNYWISCCYFSFEEFSLKAREKNWKNYKIKTDIMQDQCSDELHMKFIIKPDRLYFDSYMDTADLQIRRELGKKAFKLGFRVIFDSRVGIPIDSICDSYKVLFDNDINELTAEVESYISNELNAGEAKMKKLLTANGVECFGKIKNLPLDSKTSKEFGKAMAEWADGDAIAQHIGYGGDFFVTNDIASNAGPESVMARDNIAKLNAKYGLKLISPIEFQSLLAMENNWGTI